MSNRKEENFEKFCAWNREREREICRFFVAIFDNKLFCNDSMMPPEIYVTVNPHS